MLHRNNALADERQSPMSPKKDSQEPETKPDVTVHIPHGQDEPVPTTTPPLPIQPMPVEPTPQPEPEPITIMPELHEETYENEGRRFPVIALYGVLALLVAAAVVFGGSWIYKKVTDQGPKIDKPISANQGQHPAAPPVNAPATSQTPQAAIPSASGGQLPNNGPGEIIAVFVGTTLAVGGLHFLYNLRRKQS